MWRSRDVLVGHVDGEVRRDGFDGAFAVTGVLEPGHPGHGGGVRGVAVTGGVERTSSHPVGTGTGGRRCCGAGCRWRTSGWRAGRCSTCGRPAVRPGRRPRPRWSRRGTTRAG
ncbi:hypothetical protein CKY47_21130 [Saccharothrix yanglingensis]|uniref:Uncharacterized protein n=1 Tax=Saccharothrix yanglingensis TaxID=659496 RepID=A0ABU0X2U4_9PSEU|nr:hypothetical protein [Saccharothrix yanglingensis]